MTNIENSIDQNKRVYPMRPSTGSAGEYADYGSGLNWGAFFLPWIWGPVHRTWWSLLCFVPGLGLIMNFILLFKGNKWAWENNEWASVDQFKASQKAWVIPGLIIWIIAIGLNVFGYFN